MKEMRKANTDASQRMIERIRSMHKGRLWTDELEKEAREAAKGQSFDSQALLWAGAACTFASPKGQLKGRGGRRCNLEDGERYLLRSIAQSKDPLLARCLLVQNISMQHGRETEAGNLLLQMVREGVFELEMDLLLETSRCVCEAFEMRNLKSLKENIGREILQSVYGKASDDSVKKLKMAFA